MTLNFFIIIRETFRDDTALAHADTSLVCCRFYCFTVVQWPGRPERASSFLSPFLKFLMMCAARALSSSSPLTLPILAVVIPPPRWRPPWAVELLPQKDVGVTLGGVGKTCCGKEWVASTSLHFYDDDDTIYIYVYICRIWKCIRARAHDRRAYVYIIYIGIVHMYIYIIYITQSCSYIYRVAHPYNFLAWSARRAANRYCVIMPKYICVCVCENSKRER